MNEEQRLFIADARELVERLYRDVEQLRTARSQGRRRRELAAQIFRRVHTLKGSAASIGFNSVGRIAHQFEAVLDGARLGRVQMSDSVLDTFEDSLDAITHDLQDEPPPAPGPNAVAVIERLAAIAAESKQQSIIANSLRTALPPDIAGSLSEYDLQHAREAIREGARLFVVSAGFGIETFDQRFRDLSKLLGESGEIIATVPGEPASADEVNFRLLYAAELIPSELQRRASALGRIEHSEIGVERANVESAVLTPATTSISPTQVAKADTLLRIELNQLDELVSTASELFRYTANTIERLGDSAKTGAVADATRNLRRRFLELEERLIKLRLVPAAEILERAAARAGRIASRQLGKEVEFEIAGGDVGIEKSLAELIADPLFHLVRNAITHGIETPEERSAAGKNQTARVRLAAFNHGSRIHVTVTDDGRGIDPDRVIAAAGQQGISMAGLSMDQCLRLIFRPGFSTSSEVSELSGRGIGLDVVDRAMEIAGGEARVTTERGRGTMFAMIMPARLSLVHCLILRCGDQLYAIDSSGVTESNRAVASEHEPAALVRLSTLLGEPNANDEIALITWQAPNYSAANTNGAQRYQIGVDEILGRQETLVRSLGRHAARWRGVGGAAELSDGTVALVLDLEELIKAQNES